MMRRLRIDQIRRRLGRIQRVWQQEIWRHQYLSQKTPRAHWYAFLRVVSICWYGMVENKIGNRAAALSYGSLLALGPLIAIMVLVSSFVLDRENPDLAADYLNRALLFIAPQVAELERVAAESEMRQETDPATTLLLEPNPQLVQFLEGIIAASQSRAIGFIGILGLIVIVIQMFTSIENALNSLWGVRRGRSLLTRVVVYWTVVTLGAVLAFGTITLLSAVTLAGLLDTIPFLSWLQPLAGLGGPVLSFALLTLLLAGFYQFVPNTRVYWIPALSGAAIVVVLLYLNNVLAVLYLQRVLVSQSLYGSVGIILILMLGLFIFWVIVLLGGQITYAIQNAHYRSGRAAWDELNHAHKQSISLLLLVLVCRRFRECCPPYSATDLARVVKLPMQVLNAGINRLIDLGFLVALPPAAGDSPLDRRFQPARPLDSITLGAFKQQFDGFGGEDSVPADLTEATDPIVEEFEQRLREFYQQGLGEGSLADALVRFPPDEKKPASARGTS